MRRLFFLLALLVPAAPADAAVGCRSGFAIHESAGIRVFIADTARKEAGMWACTTRVRKPRLIWESSPATTLAGGVDALFGRRLAIDLEEYADGGNGRWLGWLDVRSGEVRFRDVRGPRRPVDPELDDSFTPGPAALAVASDGSLGYAFEAFEKTYELFTSRFERRRLQRERAVITLPEAEFDPATLAITSRELRWRTRGAEASAPLPASTVRTARRGRRAPGVRCSDGEGLYLANRHRVFRTGRGLYACSENTRARPVVLGGRRARLLKASSTGESLAFVVREGSRETVGAMDARSSGVRSRVRRAGEYGGRPTILDLATRSNGGVALATEIGVFYLAPSGTGLGKPVQLFAGSVAPHTVRLTRAAVTWRAVGAARSAPLR